MILVVLGCSQDKPRPVVVSYEAPGLTALRPEQLAMDFEFLAGALRAYYAPLEYKQNKFGFEYEVLVAETRSKIKATPIEEDAAHHMTRFLATFRDSHLKLSIGNTASEVAGYSLGFETVMLSGRVIVVNPDKEVEEAGLEDGDELLAIDGETPGRFLERLRGVLGTGTESALQTKVSYLTYRAISWRDLQPKSSVALVEAIGRNGEPKTVKVEWARNLRRSKRIKKALGVAERMESIWEDQLQPRMITDETTRLFDIKAVEPDQAALEAKGLKRNEILVKGQPFLRAFTWQWKGQRILLLRMPSFNLDGDYSITARQQLAYLGAVMEAFEPGVDRVILDLQGNPGGGSVLATQLVGYFTDAPYASETRHFNADRTWSLEFLQDAGVADVSESMKLMWIENSLEVDRAMAANERLTRPMRFKSPLFESRYPFRKPLLVLVDGACVSAGELAAMYLQDYGWGKIMGTTTAGAGGNVDMVLKLPHSQWELNVTRSLTVRIGSESAPRLIENEGIVPDIPYQATVEDYRNGFVEMFKAVSDAALTVERSKLKSNEARP